MRKRKLWKKRVGVMGMALLLITGMTGCKRKSNEASAAPGSNNAKTKAQELAIDADFEEEDLETSWDESKATSISLSDSEINISGDGAAALDDKVTIKDAGIYVLSGTLSNGQILVEAEEGTVRLILNGVSIYCEDSAPIYVKSADKTVITLAKDSENALSDGDTYTVDEDEEPNAALFSKDDLVINGSGTLTVTASYNNGIYSKDDLKLAGGTIRVQAVNHGIKGKDMLAVKDGTYEVNCTKDAFHSNGIMAIYGGTFEVDAEDDGFHSDEGLLITDGTININSSYEGIESAVIVIEGGEISVVASDDGINAAGGKLEEGQSESADENQSGSFDGNSNMPAGNERGMGGPMGGGMMETSSGYLYISGGNITIDADGDGIDSNTDVEISGGYIVVSGPTNDGNGSLDYGNSFIVTGGTLIATGSSGMAVAPTDGTTINTAFLGFNTQKAGSTLKILDSRNTEILSISPSKTYSSLVYSSQNLKSDEEYTVTVDGETVVTFTMSDSVTSGGTISSNMGGGPGGTGQRMTPPDADGTNGWMTPPDANSANGGTGQRMTPPDTNETNGTNGRMIPPDVNSTNGANEEGTENTL